MSVSTILGRVHLDKVGLVGSITTTLCCLGFGPLIALLSAIGAGSSSFAIPCLGRSRTVFFL